MKYYLCKFDRNWADEIDLTDIRCFSEEEYNKWCDTLVYGVDTSLFNDDIRALMDDYSEAMKELEKWSDEHSKYVKNTPWEVRVKDGSTEIALRNKATNWYARCNSIRQELDAAYGKVDKNPHRYTFKHPQIYDHLGNFGFGFEHGDFFGHILYNKDIHYSVTEVDENVYNVMKEQKLNHYGSTISVFNMDRKW